jgi:hypothetical protein
MRIVSGLVCGLALSDARAVKKTKKGPKKAAPAKTALTKSKLDEKMSTSNMAGFMQQMKLLESMDKQKVQDLIAQTVARLQSARLKSATFSNNQQSEANYNDDYIYEEDDGLKATEVRGGTFDSWGYQGDPYQPQGRGSLATQSCWSCSEYGYDDCLNNGSSTTCLGDHSSCYVREYVRATGDVVVHMGCENIFQCAHDFNDNDPVASEGLIYPNVAGLTRFGHRSLAAKCQPGEPGSVCHQCCADGEDCNKDWVTTPMTTISEWVNNSRTQSGR